RIAPRYRVRNMPPIRRNLNISKTAQRRDVRTCEPRRLLRCERHRSGRDQDGRDGYGSSDESHVVTALVESTALSVQGGVVGVVLVPRRRYRRHSPVRSFPLPTSSTLAGRKSSPP